ncbi:glycerol-3-phosphate 1-O-acyltransferase PlsY [Litorisediminicola beolgyonensis]|uniref:Glycerol-3-phosphate acyltransferase n=1 Tax=Litorisediminicola beolgyonensis TaxID=1173614 RepID=A0ABW3ZMY5_9RHOB
MPEFDTAIPLLLVLALGAYLIGSVPFGLVITRVMGLGDPRQIGSGNIGATNVLRTGSKAAGAATLLLDGLKGAVAVIVARTIAGGDAAQVAALAAFFGHCYPVWLGFKGGKGVATFLGVVLALSWPVGLLACASWVAGLALSRISSVGALTAAGLTPIWLILTGRLSMVVLGIVLALLIYWRHRSNIARLRAGTEPRVGRKS